MIILHEANTTNFTTLGIGSLPDYSNAIVTEELNGTYEVVFDYPVDGLRYKEIKNRRIVVCKPNPYSDPQPFRIYSITKPINKIVTVNAAHISYDLCGYPAVPFKATSPRDAFAKLKSASLVQQPFEFNTTSNETGTINVTQPRSIRSILGNNILKAYNGEFEFDKFMVYHYDKRGTDRGFSIRYGKNMTEMEEIEGIENVYTAVYPYWEGTNENDETVLVELPEKTVKVTGVFDFNRILTVDLSNEFNSPPTIQELTDKALAYIEKEKVGTPTVSMTVSFVDLRASDEYSYYTTLELVKLGDTVSVEFEEMSITGTARCIKTEYNVATNRYDLVELGEAKRTLSMGITTSNQYYTDTIKQQQQHFDEQIGSIKIEMLNVTEAVIEKATIDWVNANFAHILNGYLDMAQIQDASITSAMIGNAQITVAHIEDAFIEKLVATQGKFESAHIGKLTAENIDTNTLTAEHIKSIVIDAVNMNVEGKIKAERLEVSGITVDEIDAGKITSGTIDADRIGAESITADKIASGAITAGKISAGAITSEDIFADNVQIGTTHIANGAITTDKLASGVITTDKIVVGGLDGSVVIQNGTITADKIEIGAITTDKIEAGSVTADKLGSDIITGGKINANLIEVGTANITEINAAITTIKNLTADMIGAGTLNAGVIYTGTIKADQIIGGTLDLSKGITISGSSGKLTMNNQTIQIKDNQTTPVVRVQLGYDGASQYGLAVWNASGAKIFDSTLGIYPEGIENDSINGGLKLADDSVSPNKIQIEELIADRIFADRIQTVDIKTTQITGVEKIASQYLDITGLVTFSALGPDLQEKFMPMYESDGVTIKNTMINGNAIYTKTIKANDVDFNNFKISNSAGVETFSINENGEVAMAGTIQSQNWNEATKTVGWCLKPNGTAYLNDAVIRASVILPNAGISNEGSLDTSVRFWAGCTQEEVLEDPNNASFYVTQSGELVANRGRFGGTFTGSLEIGNITIQDTTSTSAEFIIADNSNNDKIKLTDGNDSIFNSDLSFGDYFKFNSTDKILEGNGGVKFTSRQGNTDYYLALNRDKNSKYVEQVSFRSTDGSHGIGRRTDDVFLHVFSDVGVVFDNYNTTEDAFVDVKGPVSVKELTIGKLRIVNKSTSTLNEFHIMI